ncbi:MAG: hypothetical protein KDD53_12755, partial [Bdellovibrionales bacterium]|nr:hypothetical protein [Bdellovibrionales bacterium]
HDLGQLYELFESLEGYHESVWEDEAQAYLASGIEPLIPTAQLLGIDLEAEYGALSETMAALGGEYLDEL